MIKTFFFWSLFAVLILISLVLGPMISIFYKKENVYQRFAVIISKIMLLIGGIKVTVSGLERIPRQENVIFVSNHQSTVDGFVLSAFLPKLFRFVIMRQIYEVPILKKFLSRAGYIMVEPADPKQAMIAMQRINSVLRRGESLVIFPEGMRSPDRKLQEFKNGTGILIMGANKTVVPIAILNSYRVMQRDEQMGLRLRPGRVKVKIGEPMTFAQFQEINLENARSIDAKLREMIEGLMRENP
ncbi:MAG: lysophospholipid acyltransferase family protein [Candidatus Margulisiibacteriota bacterium]